MPRLLDSLVHLEPGPPFRVLVLVATVHPSLANRAQARVNALIASFRERYPVAQFGAKELAFVRDWLPALGFDPALLALNSYAGVRNCQLFDLRFHVHR